MSDKNRKSKKNLRLLAMCGIFTALVFIGTELRIPTAIGHINLGDAVILIASYFIGPAAFFPAAIGSALGDLIAGYPYYIAPTFVIKGAMAIVTALMLRTKSAKGGKPGGVFLRILAFVIAEVIMIGGYFVFEMFMYGKEAALGSVVFNLIQAAVSVATAGVLTHTMKLKK